MINQPAKGGEVPESTECAKKPKSAELGQPLKTPDNLSSQKPKPDAQQAKQSWLGQTSKKSDVPHVEVEIVCDMSNANRGDSPPYKRIKIIEDQIPSVLGLEPKPAGRLQRLQWLFTPIDARRIIKILRRLLLFLA